MPSIHSAALQQGYPGPKYSTVRCDFKDYSYKASHFYSSILLWASALMLKLCSTSVKQHLYTTVHNANLTKDRWSCHEQGGMHLVIA